MEQKIINILSKEKCYEVGNNPGSYNAGMKMLTILSLKYHHNELDEEKFQHYFEQLNLGDIPQDDKVSLVECKN